MAACANTKALLDALFYQSELSGAIIKTLTFVRVFIFSFARGVGFEREGGGKRKFPACRGELLENPKVLECTVPSAGRAVRIPIPVGSQKKKERFLPVFFILNFTRT